jgi:hypothetical protein
VRPHAVRCHTCGRRSLRSSDSPPLPAPEVPVHQHRVLDDAQTRFDQVAVSDRRAVGVWGRIPTMCEVGAGLV